MKKDKNIENFDICFEGYLKETDPKLHKTSIISLLASVDLDLEFKERLKDEKEIERFFLTWKIAGELEKDPKERKGLQQLGKLSEEFYIKKQYKKLFELFFDMIFRNLIDFVGAENRDDFEDITDHDLYEKGIIPPEIFFQYFLIESAVKNPKFDWKRNDEIMKQNLACLITCFGDIYEFMNE